MTMNEITIWLDERTVTNATHLLLLATTVCLLVWLMRALHENKVYKKGTRFLTTELCKSSARERVFASELFDHCGNSVFEAATTEIQEANLLPTRECIDLVQKMDAVFSVCKCPDCRKEREMKARAKSKVEGKQHVKT